MKRMICVLFLMLMTHTGFSQQVVINEVMSSNLEAYADEDGEFSDWVELYNPGTNPVNLKSWSISDDADEVDKWKFPEIVMPAQSYLVLFASDKNRSLYAPYMETIINKGDIWKYRPGTSEPPSNWREINFDDGNWNAGPSGFGFSDGDDATVVQRVNSVYVRHKFQITNVSDVLLAQLHVDYDDGFVAYVNGVEIARANIGQPGGNPPSYNSYASSAREPMMYQGGSPEYFDVTAVRSLLVNGDNVLAIQVHNVSASSSDLSLIPFFTLGLQSEPANPRGMPDLLKFSLPKLHTNFKISGSGEDLLLVDSTGTVVDSIDTGYIPTDISRGRYPDGSNSWYYFQRPTPGEANTAGYGGVVDDPRFSLSGGFYSGTKSLQIAGPSSPAMTYYTTDGSEPTAKSKQVTGAITISKTTVVRARSFEAGKIPSHIITQTYFINESINFTVISLTTDPVNLWSDSIGIYATGPNAQPADPHYGANYWEDWERPVHIEFFEPDGSMGFSMNGGIKIFGGWSRARPQKSFSIFARGRYGTSEIAYKIFENNPITSFQSFILRNSGNDWVGEWGGYTMFRDVLMTGLVGPTGIEVQDYRPAVIFLNGEYWGILNIREKISEHYLASHFPVDPDDVDMLENEKSVINGDAGHYTEMLDFLHQHSLADSANFAYINTQMDVENFFRYHIAQIYYHNTDWPGNNIKFWRPRTANGRWRWILYDTDFGLGLYGETRYTINTLVYALEPNGPDYPNPPWSTLILRKLLENVEGKYQFINLFSDYLNSVFDPTYINEKVDEIKALIEPQMPRHLSRWGGNMQNWNSQIQVIRNFATYRPAYQRAHLMSKFNLKTPVKLTVEVTPPNSGKVKVSTLQPENYPWQGQYFPNVPFTVIALPANGYQFVGWDDDPTITSAKRELNLSANKTISARFEPAGFSDNTIVINEINYNSADDFDTDDWVEFYNNSDQPIDISGWIFRDEDPDHGYVFPANTVLDAGEYVVICCDADKFHEKFPDVTNISGYFDFGFSGGGEHLRISNAQGEVIDSLTYDDGDPWPDEPDAGGATLALKNPSLDNALGENWAASLSHGTPGMQNDVYTRVGKDDEEFVPKQYELAQNYPNPFNPETVIRFQLPESQVVTLTIYDLLGKKVTVLLNQKMDAGTHELTWRPDASVASGLYFYRLSTTNRQIGFKKMLYVK